MFIGHIVEEFFYGYGGLPYKQISDFSEALMREGFKFVIFTNRFHAKEDDDPPFLVKEFKWKFPLLLNPKLIKEVNSLDIDILHVHMGSPKALPFLRRFAIKYKRPLILSVYERPSFSELWRDAKVRGSVISFIRDPPYPNFLTKYFLNIPNLTQVIVPSYRMKRYFQRIIPKVIVKRIPPGVNLEKWRPVVNPEFKESLGLSGRILLYLGHGTTPWVRGLDTLGQAFILLKERFSELKLLFLLFPGFTGKDRMFVEKLRPTLGKYIKYIEGTVAHPENFVNISDVVVFPFKSSVGIPEYPLSILEAMASGKVVITTNIGALPEVVKHNINGLVVEPNNPKNLANEIDKVLRDELFARKLGEEARRFVQRNFDLNELSKLMAKVYEEVV
ncbi:MAG: glycosyltransferase family 4 protein [Candidatus Bathyarchaeia archaeon]